MLTSEVIEKSVHHLSKTQKAYLRKQHLTDNKTEDLSGVALIYWIADMLSMVNLIDSDQQRLLMEEFEKDLLKFGTELYKAVEDQNSDLPVFKLGFGDRLTAAVTGRKAALNLNTGESLVNWKDSQFLETVNYNLTTLFVRKYLALKKREKTDAG